MAAWVAYWDRKRHGARGASRSCVVCRIEELKAHARRWPEFLAVGQEQAAPPQGMALSLRVRQLDG